MSLRILFMLTALFLLTSCTKTENNEIAFYVSPKGDDSHDGKSVKKAFATFEQARDAIRVLKQDGVLNSPVTVYVLGGTYILSEPFSLSTEDSGTRDYPVTYQAYQDEKPVISGGIEVHNWSEAEFNGIRVLVSDLSSLPDGSTPFEQLWINGQRAPQARTPNSGYLRIPFDESIITNMTEGLRGQMDELPYHADDEHNFDGIEDGVVVAFYKWLEFHLPIDRIDRENDNIIFAGKSMRRVETNEHYYLEGGRAMLDKPGEWYLDRQADKLYYYPLEGESDVVAVIPSLNNVLRITGDAAGGQWVEHVQFRGLTFSHTTWILPRDSGPAGLGQADIRDIEGAVRLRDARNCLFKECEVTAIGNYGIEISLGCSNNRVLRCDIHDLGAGGFLIGPKIRPRRNRGDDAQGESPVLENPWDATSDNEIADCRIHDGGHFYHCAVGIWIGQSPDNHIHHNEISDFLYSAISTGWTWGYHQALATGNIFEYNYIHHLGERQDGDGPVLSDLGGIYFLGDQTGTVVRHNVFHDIMASKYGGWALYTDQGSLNLLIENNLAYRCRHACFDQHFGKDNIIRNNIFAFGDASVVMLAKAEEHTGFILKNNILLSDGTPIYAGGYEYFVEMTGAFEADSNLVWSTAGKVIAAQNRFPSRLYEPDEPVMSWEEWLKLGRDQNSIIADPGFADPENGDFTLPDDSPAFKIGFKPFPLDQAGPR